MEKVSRIYDSPVGRLRLEATAEGICALTWPKDDGDGEVEVTVDTREIAIARQHLATCTDWLSAYFNGSLLESPVPRPPLVIPKEGTTPTIPVTASFLSSLNSQVPFPTMYGQLCAVQRLVKL